MTTYADPTRCPDCHAVLPYDPQVCQACGLPLTGETVVALFASLQEADRLLGTLRAQRRPVPTPVGATSAAGSLLAGVEQYPVARRHPSAPAAPGPKIRGTSVPKILLSLGAACLLVAAVTFLAVAWSWLGVGGRTAVLVGLTGTALGSAVALHRRGLRTAAESVSVIGLGLLALDLTGARHAGWLGPIDDAGLTVVVGAVVGAAALLVLLATVRRPLAAPALIAPVAILVGGCGAQSAHHSPLPMLVTVVLLLALGRVGTALPSTTLQVTAIATAALGWLSLIPAGIDQAGDPLTFAHAVGDLASWPLLAAALVAAAVGPVTGTGRGVAYPGYALAGLVGSYVVVLPVLDNAPTAAVSAVLAVSLFWVAALMLAPRSLRPVALLPLAGTLVVPATAAAGLLDDASRAVLTVGSPFSQPYDVHVAPVSPWISPLLLVPTLLTLAAGGCAALQLAQPVRRIVWARTLGTALVIGLIATVPSYDVPLAVVVGLVLIAAIGTFAAAERLPHAHADLTRLGSLALTVGTTLIALPSDRLTAAVLVVACAMAGYLMPRPNTAGAVASLCLPVVLTGLVWAGGSDVGADEQFRAVPALLALGALAIWRPQVGLEASAAFAGTLVSVASIVMARDLDVALAIHLTIAGMLVTASSIIHSERRSLAWPGGLLLVAATWVRLADLGVQTPEAYTLPSALVLIAVGGWRLREDTRSVTLTCLAPGLALATVPSLVAMLDEPYSLRALLLGLACLALIVTGTAMRWSAPLVVGAAVGTLLVLRELAPYTADVPSWLTIGASGAVLLAVGITWESRMNDVRRAQRYVAALR